MVSSHWLQALSTLDKVITDKLEDLSEITATPTSQLKFVTDAWSQVVDCRRMLKWTYAFGYYRFAEQTATTKPQQEFFEFNQVCLGTGAQFWKQTSTLMFVMFYNMQLTCFLMFVMFNISQQTSCN